MTMFRLAVLTALVTVASCSVTWNDIERFFEEDRLEKRDIWDTATGEKLTCPDGKAVSSIHVSNGKMGISCEKDMDSSNCEWTWARKAKTVANCRIGTNLGVLAGIQPETQFLRCCKLQKAISNISGEMLRGSAASRPRYDVLPGFQYFCGFLFDLSGIKPILLMHCRP